MTTALLTLSLIAGTFPLLDDSQPQTATVEVRHPLRKLDAVSHNIEGAADLSDGVLRAHLRVRVDSFRSGNANADEYLQEALNVARFPYVDVRVLVPRSDLPSEGEIAVPARVTMNGISRTVTVAVRLSSESRGGIVKGVFAVDLEDFEVSPPVYLLMPIDHQVRMSFELKTLPVNPPQQQISAATPERRPVVALLPKEMDGGGR